MWPMTIVVPPSPTRFAVWFDLACDDFMALEAQAMTEKLKSALEGEGVNVLYVEAADRKEAVKKAFPQKPLMASALTWRPSPGRRLH